LKLNYRNTVLVGFIFFLICLFWQAYDAIIPKILTDKFGLAQGPSGIIMALDNVLALFLLPLFGALSDKCTHRKGRRTPFIVAGTLIAVIAFLGLSAVDSWQLSYVKDVSPENPEAQAVLYEANPTFSTPDGEKIVLQERFSKEEFTSISLTVETESGEAANPDYTNYVVPARQAYAWQVTMQNPVILVCFIAVLLIVLFAMASFRSPAVALMPDVTVKPLRSKGNAIINLMGAAGGIVVLALGMIFSTGSAKNALMNYTAYFGIIAAIMLVSLFIFLWTVNEPKLVSEMHEESRKYGLDTGDDEEQGGDHKLSRAEFRSLVLILASVMLWYMGYNAVWSKYSVYAGKVLDLDFNSTLTLASAFAIIAYVPIGFLAEKWGRRKTILLGVLLLGVSFAAGSFMRAGDSPILINFLFALAGIGWATINVNSYPMVVELSKNSDAGKYTGYYYTASMLGQTLTPILSGYLMDIRFTLLFPYAALFVFASFVTMFFVRHGDSKPIPSKSVLERFDTDD